MEAIAHSIIRPHRYPSHREIYDPETALGACFILLQGTICRRRDYQLVNSRKLVLECSLFEPFQRLEHRPAVVVYCHGNCGSRQDALDVVETMIPQGMAVCAFDFAGSGISQGKYVTLGCYEQFDVSTVVSHLRDSLKFTNIALWGRSMGAVASILHAARDPFLQALVLDSPFASLPEISKTIMMTYRWVPSAFYGSILAAIRKRIIGTAGFDIEDVQPIKVITRCKAPVAFIHSIEDQIVPLAQAVRLYEQYPNQAKVILKVPGGHNARREKWMNEEIARFLVKSVGGRGTANRSVYDLKASDPTKSPESSCLKSKLECESFMSVPVSPTPGSPQTAGIRSTKDLFGSRRGSIF